MPRQTPSTPRASAALTPKGALVAALGWEQGRLAWSTLQDHAKRTADYRELRGVPAITVADGGGVCVVDGGGK